MKRFISGLLLVLTGLLVLFWTWLFVQLIQQSSASAHAGAYNLQTDAGLFRFVAAISLIAIVTMFVLGLINLMFKGPVEWKSFSYIFFLMAASPVAALFVNFYGEKHGQPSTLALSKQGASDSSSSGATENMPAPGPPSSSEPSSIVWPTSSRATETQAKNEHTSPSYTTYVNPDHVHEVTQPPQPRAAHISASLDVAPLGATPAKDTWEWKMPDGSVYSDVVLETADADHVSILYTGGHTVGHTTVKVVDLPPELQGPVNYLIAEHVLPPGKGDTESAANSHQVSRTK